MTTTFYNGVQTGRESEGYSDSNRIDVPDNVLPGSREKLFRNEV